MNLSIHKMLTFLVLTSVAQAASAEPIKVLLARTSTSVNVSVVRSTLLQMNTTMSNSGLGSLDFVSASSTFGNPDVEFVTGCTSTNPVTLLNCIRNKLKTQRDTVNADVVVTVVPSLSLCGSVMPQMINANYISDDNQHLAYAVLKLSCITAPSNNMKVASHEVGHLLSLEHHDNDPEPNKPAGYPANHAEEDFDDHTVMGSPTDDCLIPSIACNGHDFLSAVGATFPDGGSAGNSSQSNAKAVVSSKSWDVVAAYRPRPSPPACSVSVTLMSCNFSGSGNFQVTAFLPGYNVSNADYDISVGGSGFWGNIFEGPLTCPTFNLGASAVVRAILTTVQGTSQCTTNVYVPPNFCDDGGQVPL